MKKETKELRSCRVGQFRVSLLEQTRTYQQREDKRDYCPEKTIKSTFISIQKGMKVDGQWVNQTIFCSNHEFHNLQDALDDFNHLKDEEGDKKSPNSTPTPRGDAQ